MAEKIKCSDCGKKFSTGEALEQHRLAKHIKKEPKKKRELRKGPVFTIVIIVIIALGVLLFVSSDPSVFYNPLRPPEDHTLGDIDAPVTMIEFSDFECTFCGQFAMGIEKQIIEEYIETGQIRLIYKHFPLTQIHQYAQKAAEASECAADIGGNEKFWEYHDLAFENQNALFANSLKSYASEIGLDRGLFDACLDSGAMAPRVNANIEEALQKGVTSTPIFFINDFQIRGAQTISSFQQAIETELAKV